MSLQAFFALLGGMLVLAFVANRLAQRTRVPDAVVLILTGMLLGPVFGLVDAAQFENVTRGFGTLALILILFEGGLELDVRETLRHLGGGLVLSWSAYIITATLVAGVARWSLLLSWRGSLLVGAVLGLRQQHHHASRPATDSPAQARQAHAVGGKFHRGRAGGAHRGRPAERLAVAGLSG